MKLSFCTSQLFTFFSPIATGSPAIPNSDACVFIRVTLCIGGKCYCKFCKNDNAKENADMIIINQNFHRRMEDNAVGGDRCGEHGHGVQEVCQGRPPKCYECLNVSLF